MGKRVTRHQYDQVAEFRNRLVAYMNLILEHGGRGNLYGSGPPDWVMARLRDEQPWLSQTYGKLIHLIHPSGVAQGMAMGYGSIQTSADVIADAIHNPGHGWYHDLARIADQHLTMRLGQMQGEIEEKEEVAASRTVDPDAFWRLTNPFYWLGRIPVALWWIVATKGGRIVGLIGAAILAIIGGIASGWAQAVFTPR